MINVSTIKTHMYCPMKLYLKNYLDEEEKSDLYLHNEMKNIRIDLQDLMQKNMRKINRKMDNNEIKETLNKGIPGYIKNSIESIDTEEYDIKEEIIIDLESELKNECNLNLDLLSLKSQKAMKSLNKDGAQIVEMFFPNCMYTYLIRDPQLELIGVCDKIEIINGHYFPISIKSGNPPLKGVWDQDAIELVANAILIEQEFDCEVFVGFVDYVKIGDRRPVIMDVSLRKSLFNVINEINETIQNKKMPKIKINENKCKYCDYERICIKERG